MSYASTPQGIVPLDIRAPLEGRRAIGCLTALCGLMTLLFGILAVIGILAGVLPATVFFVALAITMIVGLFAVMSRYRTWLEGTRLVVQRLFGRTYIELATAQVWIDSMAEQTTVSTGNATMSVPTGRRIPLLVVQDVTTGKRMRLPLRGKGGLLPPHQLYALAGAISAGPRPQPYDQQAAHIAGALRGLGDNPMHGHL
jgi:hypothetical protein